MGVRLSVGQLEGSVPSVPDKCWHKHRIVQYDASCCLVANRDLCTGFWGTGFGGNGEWLGPSLPSLKDVESCLECPAEDPRAGWQEPVASPGQTKPQARLRLAAGLPWDHLSHSDWGKLSHTSVARDLGDYGGQF